MIRALTTQSGVQTQPVIQSRWEWGRDLERTGGDGFMSHTIRAWNNDYNTASQRFSLGSYPPWWSHYSIFSFDIYISSDWNQDWTRGITKDLCHITSFTSPHINGSKCNLVNCLPYLFRRRVTVRRRGWRPDRWLLHRGPSATREAEHGRQRTNRSTATKQWWSYLVQEKQSRVTNQTNRLPDVYTFISISDSYLKL